MIDGLTPHPIHDLNMENIDSLQWRLYLRKSYRFHRTARPGRPAVCRDTVRAWMADSFAHQGKLC